MAAISPAAPAVADTLADRVYQAVFADIAEGRLAESARLPSEFDFCARFGVSRPVVREALQRLRCDGIIVSRKGAGSFVRRRPEPQVVELAPIDSVADILRCLELRKAIESEAAFLAAQRRGADSLRTLCQILGRLEDELQLGPTHTETDWLFHYEIARATGNRMFAATVMTLKRHISFGQAVARVLSERRAERRNLVHREHIAIFEAIWAGNPQLAYELMRRHIEFTRSRLVGDDPPPPLAETRGMQSGDGTGKA